jgi:hypothetical protein
MDKINKSMSYFLLGCIPLRLFITYIAKTKPEYQSKMSILALVIGIGFLSIYFLGLRKTGIEVGGEKIWWDNWRPVHGLLFLAFAYMAHNNNKNAWKVLLADTLLGLSLFLHYHCIQNDHC